MNYERKMKTLAALGLTCAIAFSCVSCGGEVHHLAFVEGKAAACNETGNVAYWVCLDCNERFLDEAATIRMESVEIPALNHNFVEKKEVSCLEEGILTRVCERCGAVASEEVIPAVGHDFGEFVVTKPADCNEAGVETAYCSRCDETKTREIPRVKRHVFDTDNVCTICSLEAYPTDGLSFSLLVEDGRQIGYSVTSEGVRESNVVIPCYYRGLPVLEIGNGAFAENMTVSTVLIYADIVEIGDSAFENCMRLTSAELPDSLQRIGGKAFRGCGVLNQISIPDALSTLGEDAFRGCTGAKSLYLGKSVTSIGNNAFWNCNGLKEIIVSEENETFLGAGNCLIERKTGILVLGCGTSEIPFSVTKIAEYAFFGCTTLAHITIPTSVTQIGDFAFRDCISLKEIRYGGTSEEWDKISKGINWCANANKELVVVCFDKTIPVF